MAAAGSAAATMQSASAGAQSAGTKRELQRRRSLSGGAQITQWRITVQPDRANVAHCHRCKSSFAKHEFRMQAYRASEAATGKRNTDRYFHVACVDATLPNAREMIDIGKLSLEQKQQLDSLVGTFNMETAGSRKQPKKQAPEAEADNVQQGNGSSSSASNTGHKPSCSGTTAAPAEGEGRTPVPISISTPRTMKKPQPAPATSAKCAGGTKREAEATPETPPPSGGGFSGRNGHRRGEEGVDDMQVDAEAKENSSVQLPCDASDDEDLLDELPNAVRPDLNQGELMHMEWWDTVN